MSLASPLIRTAAWGRQSPRRPHPDFVETPIDLRGARITRDILTAAAGALGSDWQATVLRSHLLLYKENDPSFPDAEILGRR